MDFCVTKLVRCPMSIVLHQVLWCIYNPAHVEVHSMWDETHWMEDGFNKSKMSFVYQIFSTCVCDKWGYTKTKMKGAMGVD